MKLFKILTILCIPFFANAQKTGYLLLPDTGHIRELSDYTVSGMRETTTKLTSLNLQPYKLSTLDKKASLNLSDALARIPGISQMSTGNSISKPVIRGLYGNRILVLLSGLRFDNQQFQDEHGLGLSQIGIDRIEVVKGPASLLYGTDAIGGVVNIIESMPAKGTNDVDLNIRLYPNTGGTLTDAGISKNNGKSWYRIRAGAESHSDYSDGNNTRILNSRNNGYYLKAGAGFDHKKWSQQNSYNFSYNQYGFIMDSMTRLYVNDGKFSRSMAGPHHNVMLNTLSSQNRFTLPSSVLKLNVGLQSNKREEDEGSGQISLNMHLLSVLENAKWEKQLSHTLLFIANQQFTYERNKNLGKRILIPDATTIENNVSGFLRLSLDKLVAEAGVGYNNKNITTYTTKSLNSGNANTPDTTILPFNVSRGAINTMLGVSYNPNRFLNIKLNAATGNRSANLAELSSNGLHEGTYRVEIGNPSLKMEQNINTDISVSFKKDKLSLDVSGFCNRILNYIYLNKENGAQWYGFDKYRYTQQNATLYGLEAIAAVNITKQLTLKETYSSVYGMLDAGGYMPFITSARLKSGIEYNKQFSSKTSFYIEPEFEYAFAQNRPATFELASLDYGLVNLYTGLNTSVKNRNIRLVFACRNMLNKYYADHLSRIRYYGFYNQGINFNVSIFTNLHIH